MKLPMMADQDIFRILKDLLKGELQVIRGPQSVLTDFTHDAVFTDAPWHLDYMEIMEMAAVNEFFHLYKTGLEDNLIPINDLGKKRDWIYEQR